MVQKLYMEETEPVVEEGADTETTAKLSRLEQDIAARDSELAALKDTLAGAVAKYRAAVAATASGMPEELIRGETVEEIDAWKQRDPIRLFRENLIGMGICTESDIDRIDREIDVEMAEVERFANESPLPEVDHLHDLLYADPAEEVTG